MSRRTTPPADPCRAVAYLRVSTEEQALGPEAQRAAIERWALARVPPVLIVAWLEDRGVSGAAPIDKRPGLIAALDALREHGAGLLVVSKRDRLARDVVAAGMIEALAARHGAVVMSAAGEGDGDDPAAGLLRRMVDAFAEYERALIRARTSAALAVKRARREYCGGDAPYGSQLGAPEERGRKRDGRPHVVHALDPVPEETAAVACMREMRAAGAPLRATCAELTLRGFRPRSGAAWHPQTVARVLARLP